MRSFPKVCGNSRSECDAFLLGNQGPDPLFFVRKPMPGATLELGRMMHEQHPARLLACLRQGLDALDQDEQPIGRAYAHGFLCHYLLDSSMHPLVYALVEEICGAGVEGLDSKDKSLVHHYIENEWDEMVLTVKMGTTVASYRPADILNVQERILTIVQKLYSFMSLGTYGRMLEAGAFRTAVLMYYLEQRALHSRTGAKRAVLSALEGLVRPHSLVRATSPRPVQVETTWLANPSNRRWVNPATGEGSTQSFWDIYDAAVAAAKGMVGTFDDPGFDEEAAHRLTGDVNFKGQPTVATITVHEEG